MKKARNLWCDLPQGGSRYGSVLTRLFLLVCMLTTASSGWAQTTFTYTGSSGYDTNGTTHNNITVTFSNGSHSNSNGGYWGVSAQNATLTVTSTSANITNIEINYNGTNYAKDDLEIKTGSGTYALSSTTGTYTTSTPEQNVVLKFKTSGARISTVVVTTSGSGGSTTIAAPTFTFGGSAQAANSTISSGVHTGDVVRIDAESGKYIYADWSSSTSQAKTYVFDSGKTAKNQNYYEAVITSGGTRVIYAVAGVNNDGTGASSDLTYIQFTGVTPQNPTFSVAEGSVAKNSTLELTAGYNQDKIYYTYTTDGNEPADPTTSSTLYSSALNIFTADNTTYKIKAVAYDKDGNNPSSVILKTYTTPAAATAYAVTQASTTNGSFTVSPASATEGTTITVTTSPASGYEVDAVTLSTGGSVTKAAENSYTFSMPASAVEVTVTFKEASTPSAGKTWDFTTMSDADQEEYSAETTYWQAQTSNNVITYYKDKFPSTSANTYVNYDSSPITQISGLKFFRTSSSLSGGYFRPYLPTATADGYLLINGDKYGIAIPNSYVETGASITLDYEGTGDNYGFNITNGSVTNAYHNGRTSVTFTVTDGSQDVKINANKSAQKIYKITIGTSTAPTFTTSPANNASGVAVDAAVTMTANNGTISMVGGTIAGTLKEGDATAVAATFTLNGNVLTLTHSGNFKNNTTYEVTLNADQVKNTIGNNTATTFSFTTASPVLTVSNATGSSISVAGGDVTLTKGVTGNSGEGTWTFASSNTSVATVTDAGVVTPLTAGNTTITATYTLDGQNYTKTYNMTVTAASASSAKWDFTTLTEDEITSMSENSKSLNEDTTNKFFKNKSWDKSGSQFYGGSNGDKVLNVCEGIVFDNRGNSISNGNIRFYYTEGNKRINLSNGYRMILPATVSSGKVRVTWSSTSSSEAALSPTNATYSGSGSATSKSTTPITSEFTVTAASPAFAAQNAAIYIYKVELGDSYDVAEPTLTPAEQNFTSSSSLSVTINSTQTDGTTVTHYYGFGTEKKTKEQLVSEGKTVTSNSSVTPESGIENNLVLSVVTKVVKGSNTYYSDVVTGNYTYTGTRTGSLKLTDLHIQQGQRGLIFPSIVDASGNTILFGEDDASSVDLSKYFTFTYSKNSGGTSDENITVNVAEDGLNGDVYTKKDGNLAPVGATAVIKVTATPKDAALTYVPNQNIVGTVNVTVIAKVQGLDWATLWWDKEMTANQITVENGDYTVDDNESSTTKNYGIFNGTPNGRVIYVKPDVSKCDSICYFLQTKTADKPTVSISYITMSSGNYHHYRHGIPIYIEGLTNGDTEANKTLWLSILGFKKTIVDGKETWIDAGSVMNMKFTLTPHALASNPVYAEETTVRQNTNRGTTVYTSDDGNTRNNTDINELYGKWSSKDSYTVTQMMTMPGTYVTYGVGSISVYSTEIGNRKLSAVQVARTEENSEIFYYVSAVDNSHTYKFDIGTNLKFSQTDYTVNVSGTSGTNVDFTEPTVTGTYYDKGNKVTKEISYVTSGPTTTTSNLTYELIGTIPTGVSINASTGELTIDNGTITSQFRVKATYIGGEAIKNRGGETFPESTEPYTINKKGPGYTAPSSTEYTVNIVNPIEHVPSIQPATCNFSNTINVSISTPMSENGESYGVYYTIDGTDPTDGNGNYHGTYIKPDQNDVVTLGADLAIDETVTVKAVAVGTPTTYESRIVSETYTKKKEVARPTFSPDGTSEPYYYYSSDKSLKVNISASDGATIYFTIGNPNVELISENLYEGLEGAVINGSGSIYAVAVKDGVRSSVAKSDYVYTTSIAAPVFVVEGNNYPTASTTSIEVTPETNIGLTAAQGNIYYTLDGSTPSENNGILYTGPFTTFHTITARAIAVDGEASSRVTTMTFTVPYDAAENDFWEAVEETTPGGVLAANKRVISKANNSPRAVKYLTAVFGGGLNEFYGNEPWSDRPINEASVGMPIDGVGTYSIRIDTEAKDELNVLYDHANAKGEGGLSEKAPRSAKIPVQGNIVRFEPERTGDLTIWALQEGALNYSNGKFCNAILSCRPVYLVDEQGQSIQPTLATSNSRLSANWDLLVSKENLLDKGQSQNGLTNNAYTQAQEQAIYDMFIDMLNGKGAGDNITNLKYIHNSEKQWNITDNVNDNTGYAIPSTGYVKYTFPVKANKTYYFFSPRGKIGIRGFRFVPESTEPTTLTITEAGPNADNIIAAKGQTRKTSGFDRAYPANWTALTLPFSLSESQVRSIFGDEVSVLLFDRIEGTTIYLKRHYNQGIIAGVPVIIKGSTAVDKATSLNNLHVYVEETTAQNTTSEGYTYEGNFDPVDVNKYDYYMNSTGGISRWTNNATTTKPIKSLRAVIRNINHSSAKLNMFMRTFMEEDENNVLTGIQVIYDEVTGDINVIDNANIYNINGQLVRKNAKSLEGLPKGIYIVNGKKVAVK